MRATPWHCGDGCVRIRFRGSHGDAPDRYRELIWYTAEQGLDITGFSREIALIDEGLTSDPPSS